MRVALQYWLELIRAAAKEPTHLRELVSGKSSYKGTLDNAVSWGAGGVWVTGTEDRVPIVWRVKWHNEVLARLVVEDNPNGDIANFNLEIAAKILGFMVLKANVTLRWKHVGVCTTTPSLRHGK